MRKLLLLALILMLPVIADANPFLIADPYQASLPPEETPESFQLLLDSAAPAACQMVTDATGKWPKCDLAGIANGQHTAKIKACNAWGCVDSNPFVFTKALPATPSGIRLTKE